MARGRNTRRPKYNESISAMTMVLVTAFPRVTPILHGMALGGGWTVLRSQMRQEMSIYIDTIYVVMYNLHHRSLVSS